MEVDEDESIRHGTHSCCAQCAKQFDENDHDVVECFGKCRLAIHVNCLPGATAEQIESLRGLHNAQYVCDSCLALHDFDDVHCQKSLGEILVKLNEFASVVELAKILIVV